MSFNIKGFVGALSSIVTIGCTVCQALGKGKKSEAMKDVIEEKTSNLVGLFGSHIVDIVINEIEELKPDAQAIIVAKVKDLFDDAINKIEDRIKKIKG
jgi:hypothetical protein